MAIKINKQYISTKNTSGSGNPNLYIVIHETDNTSRGAGAQRHASAQAAGSFADMSVHYYCGSDGIYQAANHTMKCWHIGRNYVSKPNVPGANNSNSIGIEICVNSDGNYTVARNNAIELTKYLMKELKLPASRVIRHYDAKGKYCPRKMLDNPALWNDFKKQIGSTSSTPAPAPSTPAPTPTNYYRVGTGWSNGVCVGQIGAFTALANAKTACLPGYKVYDHNGKMVYENKAKGTQATIFKGMANKDAAAKMLELCRKDASLHGIFPSVKTAQMILESGYGTTELAQHANNHFGMKTTLSGNTWSGSAWDGKSKYAKKTEEHVGGKVITITADFRKYACVEDSIADHSAYLLGAMNGSKLRYAGIQKCKNYTEQITLIKNGGYATDVNYIKKITDIIKRFELDKYDKEVSGTPATPAPQQPAAPTPAPASPKPSTPTQKTYTVKKGDTLSAIGKKFGVTVANLVKWNNIKNANEIAIGQIVNLQAPATTSKHFKIRVSTSNLRIRAGAGTKYKEVSKCPKGVFTITETKSANGYTWGKLLSGKGWVALEFATKL